MSRLDAWALAFIASAMVTVSGIEGGTPAAWGLGALTLVLGAATMQAARVEHARIIALTEDPRGQ